MAELIDPLLSVERPYRGNGDGDRLRLNFNPFVMAVSTRSERPESTDCVL